MSIHFRWLNDAGLVRRTLAGNRDAFGVLVERHLAMAHALAWGHTGSAEDADDVVQDAFLKAFTKLDNLREAEKFPGWLAGIVRNLAADIRARSARMDTVSPDTLAHLPAAARRIEDDEIHALLRDTILTLEEPAREVLTLHYFARKSLREVAELQGISREAAMKRLQRAREALGKQLLKKLDAAPRPAKRLEARKSAILAAIAGTPFAWKASAATGISVSAGAIVLAALALLGASGYSAYEYRDLFLRKVTEHQTDPSSAQLNVDIARAANETGKQEAPPDLADENKADAASGSVAVRVHNLQGVVVPNATVRIELVDWSPPALPPAETKRFEARSDANGAVAFEGLSFGDYSVLAFSGNTIDVTQTNLYREQTHTQEDLYLKPGLPIAGRVVNGRGTPVAAALLVPSFYVPIGPVNDYTVASAVRVTTDNSGRFKFGLIWPGGWKFLVRAHGYGDTESPQIEAGSLDAVVTMAGAARVIGHVTRASDHAPMPGVEVRLRSKESDAITLSAKSGDDGTFEMENLSPGGYKVELVDQYAAIEEGPKEINITEGQELPLDLVLGGGATVSGKIYFKDTKEGVPQVDVSLFPINSGISRNIKSDADGGFFFTSLPDGEYSISVSEHDGILREPGQDSTLVISGAREYEMNIPVIHALELAGVVLDENGAPADHFMVNGIATSPAVSYPEGIFAEGKEDGHFTLHLRPGSHDVKLFASAKGAKSDILQLDSVPAQGLSEIVLRLTIKGSATVKATVNTGGIEQLVAANKIQVFLSQEGATFGGAPSVRLSATGEVTFENVYAGRYRVSVQERSDYRTICESEPFDVAAGKTVAGIVVSCRNDGDFSISGRVVDEQHQPVPNAEAWVVTQPLNTEHRVKADGDGGFIIDKLNEDSVYVNATAPGYGTNGKQAKAGDDNVEIVLQNVRVINGRVHDASAGAAITEFYVSTRSTTDEITKRNLAEIMMGSGKKFLASDGTFSLENAPNIDLNVVVYARGYQLGVQPAPLGESATLDFSLQAGSALAGQVTAPDGTPLPSVTVSLSAPNLYFERSRELMTTTDVNGEYQYASGTIWPGLVLHFSHPDFAVTQRTVPDGGRLDVVMENGGAAQVRVTPWPLPGDYRVTSEVELLSGLSMSISETPPGSVGTISLSRLPTGTLHVSLKEHTKQTPEGNSYSENTVAHAEAEIHNGQNIEILLELPTPDPAAVSESTAISE